MRETLDQRGQRDSIEIVYMKFFAYNGSYRVPPIGLASVASRMESCDTALAAQPLSGRTTLQPHDRPRQINTLDIKSITAHWRAQIQVLVTVTAAP